jgi:hypothetical protein
MTSFASDFCDLRKQRDQDDNAAVAKIDCELVQILYFLRLLLNKTVA